MQTVDVNTVVETASSVLKHVSDEDKVLMREWAYLAMKEIGPTGINRKTDHQIPVTDLVVMKPKDCVAVEDIAFLTGELSEVPYVLDGKGESIHSHKLNYWRYIHVSDTPYYYTLSSNAEGVKWAKMTYLAMPVDEDGYPEVPDRAVYAVTLFIRQMWYFRQGEENKALAIDKLWQREKVRTTASMKTPDKLNLREFAKNWPSMIDKAIDKLKYTN